MADITISPTGEREYQVDVEEGDSQTSHRVTVPERFAEHDPERVVRESFAFLLEREPASSILSRFSLDDISRYFPEYEDELPRRLGTD